MPRDFTKSVTSTATGLGAAGIFLPYERNQIFVTAPDWSSSKALQIWVSYEDETDSYVPERQGVTADDVFTTSADGRVWVVGPCWVRPHLTNPGTGATITFPDPTATG